MSSSDELQMESYDLQNEALASLYEANLYLSRSPKNIINP
jgi:hypothetical protein